MNCQNFEQRWNELLDGGDAASMEQERALRAHAAECPACQALSRRYETLRTAIRNMGPPPAPSPEFADRCFQAWQRSVARPGFRLVRYWPVMGGLAAAAALLAVISLGGRFGQIAPRPGTGGGAVAVRPPAEPAPPLVQNSEPSRPLALVLADATSATLDLAREASAPAARIGRDVLEQTVRADEGVIPEATSPLDDAGSAASAVIQTVGNQVNEGVRPLSGSARHAFSFLLGPAADAPDEPNASF